MIDLIDKKNHQRSTGSGSTHHALMIDEVEVFTQTQLWRLALDIGWTENRMAESD